MFNSFASGGQTNRDLFANGANGNNSLLAATGTPMSDLDVALEQKLLEVDKMRKSERFASGQPRHWDLVSEIRGSDRDRPSNAAQIRNSPSSRGAKSPPGNNKKEALTFKRLLHYDKFADSRSETEKTRKHVTITFQEKDVDGHHSALALERYLKEIGIHEVWIRGHSEAKLLDADPAFHSFQDVKHIQTCDVFIALVNKAWHDDERCHAELELARKMHYTSTERAFTAPGQPRKPLVIAIRLNDGVPDSVNAHLFQHLEQVGHLVLDHASRVLAGSASKDLSMDDSKWDDDTAATLRGMTQALIRAQVVNERTLSRSSSLTRSHLLAPPAKGPDLTAKAAEAEKALKDALVSIENLKLAAASAPPLPACTGAGASSSAPVESKQRGGHLPAHANSIDPVSVSNHALPFASLLQPRYLGTLAHTMGGRMVWSLDISFDNLPDPSAIQEGEFVTGITGKVVYTLINFFPNVVRPDDSTTYWTKWCAVRIGHEATESIKCNFDPVQGLLLGEGIQVDQEHVFEDGEGALINPYQKYRMVLSHDGSMAATLYAGGEWDAVFRAHPF